MRRFEAKNKFYYNGRSYQAGEQFDALSEKDAAQLRVFWKEVREVSADEPPPTSRQRYRTRDMRKQ